jgi:hypothetical protein
MDNELIDIVTEIVADEIPYPSVETKLSHYRNKYPAICEKYKVLMQKACEPDFDMDKFIWMINIKKKVDTNRISAHDASVKVGQSLVDQYITPNLGDGSSHSIPPKQ